MLRYMVVAAALATLGGSAASAGKPVVGEIAPPFTLSLVDGGKVTSQELRGQVVLLNYWATWCVPCRTELPLLDRYYELQKQHGLRVFAATTEDSVPLYKLRKLFAVMHIPPVKRMTGPYADVRAVPTNYVIDRAGRIRYSKAGAFDLDDLNRIIVPLLQEPGPDTATAP